MAVIDVHAHMVTHALMERLKAKGGIGMGSSR